MPDMRQIKLSYSKKKEKKNTQRGLPCINLYILVYIRYLGKYLHINGFKSTHSFNVSVIEYDLFLKH